MARLSFCRLCNGIKRAGICDKCDQAGPKPTLTTGERGYDYTWQKLRANYLAKNPLCEVCQDNGDTTPARHVHHKKPFKRKDSPLRLLWTNLQAICIPCHNAAHNDEAQPCRTIKKRRKLKR